MRTASRLFAMTVALATLAGCTQVGTMGPGLPPLVAGPPTQIVSLASGTPGGTLPVARPAQTASQALGPARTRGAGSAPGLEGATLAPGAGPAGPSLAQGGGGATPLPGAAAGGTLAAPLAPALEATLTITPTAAVTATPSVTPTLVHGDVSVLATAQLVRVIDGTTIAVTIRGQPYQVRYLGIEVPDAIAPAATAKNSSLVSGQSLYLQKDVTDTDAQGQLLRYVYTKTYLVNARTGVVRLRARRAHAARHPLCGLAGRDGERSARRPQGNVGGKVGSSYSPPRLKLRTSSSPSRRRALSHAWRSVITCGWAL